MVAALAAEPRAAGSAGESRARTLCRSRLESAGFECVEQSFEYSAWPGEWGAPLVGALLAIAALLAYAAAAVQSVALERGSISMLAMALLTGVVLARRASVWFPLARRAGINLVATRGEPRLWLVAHLDSKSQPVSILVRMAGVILSASLWVGLLMLAIAGDGLARGGTPAAAVALAACVAAMPVVLSTVGADSDGAIDNATGVAAIILAAEGGALSDVGVLITTAEELGLAGAEAWLASGKRVPGFVINCDSVDDVGDLRCMLSPWSRSTAVRCRAAAEQCGVAMRVRIGRVILGVLVDGVAFASAGWDAVTVSGGRLSTLARIHTPRDVAARVSGTGVLDAARLIVALTRSVQALP